MSASSSRRRCCCCEAGAACTHCGSGTTSKRILLTLSGIVTTCRQPIDGFGRGRDQSGVTISGAWILTQVSPFDPCHWQFIENPGTSWNSRRFNPGVTGNGNPTCTGTIEAEHLRITFDAKIVDVFGTKYVDVLVAAAGNQFSGRTPFVNCVDDVTLTNGTGTSAIDGATGGTATVEWCA